MLEDKEVTARRGAAMARILAEPELELAWKRAEAACYEMFKQSTTPEAREEIHGTLRGLLRLRAEAEGVVGAGKFVERAPKRI